VGSKVSENKGARSYSGQIVGSDSYALTINIKWLGQIFFLLGGLVYGYYQIETRIKNLEIAFANADSQIVALVDKHMEEEKLKFEQMEEELKWHQKLLKGKKKK
tara:strand:+ start:118 stop:429 length:312 start_codon:yes stop_codon:yes gene_type:complete